MSNPFGDRILLVVAVLAVIIAVTAGLMVMGPPSVQRERRLDDKRAHDLREIGNAVDVYRLRNFKLPTSLHDLSDTVGVSIVDPVTSQPYEYRIVSADTYELCAVFYRASDQHASFWTHTMGRHCFSLQSRSVKR